eukprot:2190312-Prymnesium_polylepis.2
MASAATSSSANRGVPLSTRELTALVGRRWQAKPWRPRSELAGGRGSADACGTSGSCTPPVDQHTRAALSAHRLRLLAATQHAAYCRIEADAAYGAKVADNARDQGEIIHSDVPSRGPLN